MDRSSSSSSSSSVSSSLGGRAKRESSRVRKPLVPQDHVLQFYETDDFLCDVVVKFLASGLELGEPAIVIATKPHRDMFHEGLLHLGIDGVDDRVTFFDAEETLAKFMVNGMPDARLFRRHVGAALERCRRGGGRGGRVASPPSSWGAPRIRAYGEMVDVLWKQEKTLAALRLEELWNDLTNDQPMSLLCAYVMGPFYSATRGAAGDYDDSPNSSRTYRRGNVPAWMASESTEDESNDDGAAPPATKTETGTTATATAMKGTTAATPDVSLIVQHAHALEQEVEHRRALEGALRESLAERRRIEDELREANRLKDEFLAVVSHELRTPLTSIAGWASILKNQKDLPENVAKGIDVIERNARAQSRIIDDLLDASRLMRGALALQLQPASLVLLVTDALESLRTAAEAKKLTLSFARSESACSAVCDVDRMRQVITNLVTNAIKFTPEGGKIDLRLNADPETNTVTLEVSDTGKGIDAELLPHVFDRFRQGSADTIGRQGLGLGLAIVRQLVELHGGKITAKSDGPGKGATFTVVLPILPPNNNDD